MPQVLLSSPRFTNYCVCRPDYLVHGKIPLAVRFFLFFFETDGQVKYKV